MLSGFDKVDIVSYPLEVLQASGLPLKPLASIQPYSEGIEVHRPEPQGDYRVVDGRISLGISGKIIDLMSAARKVCFSLLTGSTLTRDFTCTSGDFANRQQQIRLFD